MKCEYEAIYGNLLHACKELMRLTESDNPDPAALAAAQARYMKELGVSDER